MKLTAKQIQAADALRAIRPPVIPGTNTIVSDSQRQQWYALVVSAMEWNGVTVPLGQWSTKRTANRIRLFCDRAGVPD